MVNGNCNSELGRYLLIDRLNDCCVAISWREKSSRLKLKAQRASIHKSANIALM
jgi:hypothetical protein